MKNLKSNEKKRNNKNKKLLFLNTPQDFIRPALLIV